MWNKGAVTYFESKRGRTGTKKIPLILTNFIDNGLEM